MPVHRGHDKDGAFYQWGGHGAKYHFNTETGRKRAKRKAHIQGAAAKARGADQPTMRRETKKAKTIRA